MNTQWITQEGYDFAFNPHACDAVVELVVLEVVDIFG